MITVTVGEQKTQVEKPFPKLMKNIGSGGVFYFHRYGVGLPLNEPGNFFDTETWASRWNMEHFTDFNEPITIQNA